jgi:hypothetical protein
MRVRVLSSLLGRAGRRFCVSFCVAAALTGCTRHYFRKDADKEVSEVLAEKDKYPAWHIEQYHVYPDPRARFADPTDPDHPPMPPDDPAARDMSPSPQKPGKPGVALVEGEGYLKLLAQWDEQNRAEAAAEAKKQSEGKDKSSTEAISRANYATSNPLFVTSLSIKQKQGERPPFLLKLEQALELGQINSREYQDSREDLYLTALPVTLGRFSFAAQFFAANQVIRDWAGPETPTGSQNNWTINSNAGVAKLFSTGALLLFDFANQTILNLTGPGRTVVSQSTINLDFIQPFLRGGGFAATLEPLTQVERNLVYEIRNFMRFRREFYVAIAGGGGGSITGSVFQPTGILAQPTFSPTATSTGPSAVTPGSIPAIPISGTVGLQLTPGAAGNVALQTALAAPVSGYLSTLLEAAQQQVDRYNIEKLDGFVKLAKALKEGGDLSQLQVDQFEQQLLSGQSKLLADQQDYLQTLDQLKLQLGLPTNVPIELDDADFRPLNEHFQKYEALYNSYKAASTEPFRFNTPETVMKLRGELRRIFTSSDVVKGTDFRNQVTRSWSVWEKLSDNDLQKAMTRYRDSRRKILDRKTDLETKNQELGAAEQKELDRIEFELDLGDLEDKLRQYERQPWKKDGDPTLIPRLGASVVGLSGSPLIPGPLLAASSLFPERTEPMRGRRQQQVMHGYVVNAFVQVLTEARNERMKQLHEQWPRLKPVCIEGKDLLHEPLIDSMNVASQTALHNRLDLMNVRGQLVDAWRQLAVFANALLGTFNPEFRLTSQTPAGLAQPLNFNASRTQSQIVLNTELPLVRVAERNDYRASLINYQRSRRILQRAEDEVTYDVRQELILLRQFEATYQIQTRQVELAYLTVENSLDTLQAPPTPLLAGQAAPDTATRAASLTNQLINAQTSLYNAQFTMTTIWITYLNTRQEFYRDLELMDLDERGVWIDNVEEQCKSCGTEEKQKADSDKKTRDDGDKKKTSESLPWPKPTALPTPDALLPPKGVSLPALSTLPPLKPIGVSVSTATPSRPLPILDGPGPLKGVVLPDIESAPAKSGNSHDAATSPQK